MTLKDPDSELLNHFPSSQPKKPTEACVDILLQETSRPADFTELSVKTYPREASGLSPHLSVCLSDRLTTLPLLHSQRLQWEITFLVNLIFFFKWPYLSLKKWDTWGQWGWECVFFFNFLCASLSDLSSRHHFFVTEDTGHLLFCAF